MRQTASFIPVLFWLSCVATGIQPATAPETSAPPAASLPDPDWLPSEAKEMLSARMDRHGEEMLLLLQSVMTLHHEDVELLAEQVAAEPRLRRPSLGEKGTLSALLPTRFFTLQEQLVERAHALAAAARDNDNGRIVRAYGQLAETCVSCHSVYLTPDSGFELPGE